MAQATNLFKKLEIGFVWMIFMIWTMRQQCTTARMWTLWSQLRSREEMIVVASSSNPFSRQTIPVTFQSKKELLQPLTSSMDNSQYSGLQMIKTRTLVSTTMSAGAFPYHNCFVVRDRTLWEMSSLSRFMYEACSTFKLIPLSLSLEKEPHLWLQMTTLFTVGHG